MNPSRVAMFLLSVTLGSWAGCSAADERPDEAILPEPPDSTEPASSVGAVVVQRPSASADELALRPGEERHVGVYGASFAEGHAFQGTYLEVEGGKRVILSYGRVPDREVLIGKRVVAIGKTYINEGRSVAGVHLEPRIVKLVEE